MDEVVGESLAKRLIAWGVDTIFGLPGDGINGLMEGFRRHSDQLRFVLVHHEKAAAFMATGYAKATGRLGVCCATSGPGAIHLLNGLYDAKLDHVPVATPAPLHLSVLLRPTERFFPRKCREAVEQAPRQVAARLQLRDARAKVERKARAETASDQR